MSDFDPEKVERFYAAEDFAGDYYFRLAGVPMMHERHRHVFDYVITSDFDSLYALYRSKDDGWVSVEADLPEAMLHVLIGAEGMSVRPMFYSGEMHRNSATGILEPLWVCCITGRPATWPTHWRPLPAPPSLPAAEKTTKML